MNYQSPNNHNYGEGMEVNTDIIPPSLQSFYTLACLGKVDDILGSKEGAENVSNWFREKIIGTYRAKDLEARKFLYQQVQQTKRLFNNFNADYILTKQIEYALEDLFTQLFKQSNVKIFKTSEYDDIKCGIDYIVVGKNATFGIDLKLKSKMPDYIEPDEDEKVFPTEYHLFLGSEYKINQFRGKENIRVTSGKKHFLERKELYFEPNLALLYLKYYLQQVRQGGYTNSNKSEIVTSSWELATQEYATYGDLIRENTGMNCNSVLRVVTSRGKDLFNTLVQ
ncbi:MAG: hypothetical protein V3575_05445 [Candidatus Absconditabacteria bacterium]